MQPGQTTRLVFTGKNLANAASLWTSFPSSTVPVSDDLAKGKLEAQAEQSAALSLECDTLRVKLSAARKGLAGQALGRASRV